MWAAAASAARSSVRFISATYSPNFSRIACMAASTTSRWGCRSCEALKLRVKGTGPYSWCAAGNTLHRARRMSWLQAHAAPDATDALEKRRLRSMQSAP